MAKDIKFDVEVRAKMKQGADALADAEWYRCSSRCC